MKHLKQYNENKEVDRNGYNIFLKTYFNFENLYEAINILENNNIIYDISYHKMIIKIEAYAANAYEYKILMNIDYKIDRHMQDIIDAGTTIDEIREIIQSSIYWKLTIKEELPYLKDTNKFNL